MLYVMSYKLDARSPWFGFPWKVWFYATRARFKIILANQGLFGNQTLIVNLPFLTYLAYVSRHVNLV